MKKLIIIAISIVQMATTYLYAQPITLDIAEKTVEEGKTVDVEITTPQNFDTQGILAYQLQIEFNASYLQLLSIETANTINASWGTPTYKVINNTLNIAAANAQPLSGTGVFLVLRFKALLPYWNIPINFTDNIHNYFNEGSPAMNVLNGGVQILNKPAIAVSPNSQAVTRTETLQMQVSGGVAPYQWEVSNSAVASIDANGLLTALNRGYTRVKATDAVGTTDSTDQFIEVRDVKLSIPSDLTAWQGANINIPVNINNITGIGIKSGNFTLVYDKNIITPTGIVTAGTLLENIATPVFQITQGAMSVAFAHHSELSGNSVLLYISCNVNLTACCYSQLNLSNVMFNEDIAANIQNGAFTAQALPTLSLTPMNAEMLAGENETLQFTASNGIEPYTYTVSNPALASIDQNGVCTALHSGKVRVIVTDAVGASVSSNFLTIYGTNVDIPNVTTAYMSLVEVPVYVKNMPSNEFVGALQGVIAFSGKLQLLDLVTTGTLLDGWTINYRVQNNRVSFAAANAQVFDTAGVLFKLKFQLPAQYCIGEWSDINIEQLVFNEGVPSVQTSNGALQAVRSYQLIDTTICSGTSLQLTATDGDTYLWSPDVFLSDVTAATPTASPEQTQYYSVAITNVCGTYYDDVWVSVLLPPTQPSTPSGVQELCLNSANADYWSGNSNYATSYVWKIIPDNAGVFLEQNIWATINWNNTFAGKASIIASGKNMCGITESDTFVVNITSVTTTAGYNQWNTPSAWSCGVPTILHDAVIENGAVELNTDGLCKSLTLQPQASLTVTNQASLTVADTMFLLSNANGTASFINHGNTLISTASSQLFLPEANRYYYITPPIDNATAAVFGTTQQLAADFKLYQTDGYSWTRITDDNTALQAMQGFAYKQPLASQTYQWIGNLNTGQIAIPLNNDTYTLVGNPYQSAIDWGFETSFAGWNTNNVRPVIWYRVGGEGAGTGTGYFATYNRLAGTSTLGGQRYIPPMQSFWVLAKTAGVTLSVNDSACIHQQVPLYKNENVATNGIYIVVQQDAGSCLDEMLVAFNTNAQNAYDDYDTKKMYNVGSPNINIYTLVDNNKLAVNVLSSFDKDVSIPICFDFNASGSFTMSAKDFNANDIAFVYLEDRQNGLFVDLRQQHYTFTSQAGQNNNRFVLHLYKNNPTQIQNTDSENVQIWTFDHTLYVAAQSPCVVNVFDILGKKLYQAVYTKNVNVIHTPIPSGYYCVQVIDHNKQYVKQVFVK